MSGRSTLSLLLFSLALTTLVACATPAEAPELPPAAPPQPTVAAATVLPEPTEPPVAKPAEPTATPGVVRPMPVPKPTALSIFSSNPTEGVVTADLHNREGQLIGGARLVPLPEGVLISLQISGLPPGLHGLQIAEVGKCDPPSFTSAGGHFNPDCKQHGLKNPKGPHAGDLPNLWVGGDGTATVEIVASRVTLAPGRRSLLGARGTALVITARPDDYDSNPTGNSGDRLACGAITR